ncbi:MAG: hypothetical protein HXY22_04740 [Alphaproteobacteria bacterium]|nr:hypothetical protein [Alphaproteobacteria bacterium]
MTAKPFGFDNNFEGNAQGRAGTRSGAKPQVTPEELAKIKEQAFSEGRASIEAKAAQAMALSVGEIAKAMMATLNALDREIIELRKHAAAIALSAARKIAGAALDAHPSAEVERLIGECLNNLPREPRIVVRIAPALMEPLKDRIDAIAHEHGFGGRIMLVAETGLKGADARIEWADGGIETNATNTAAGVARRTDEFFSAVHAELDASPDAGLKRSTEHGRI